VPKSRDAEKNHRWRWPAVIGAMLVVAGIGVGLVVTQGGLPGDDRGRQAEVAKRGAEVMPFDLERTTHVFTPSASGGVQKVVADDPGDNEQIRLIREHVRGEAGRFARGDFDDPASIHGDDMPGLRTLRAEYEHMRARYTELPDGAKTTYTSSDPTVVDALHDWFDAQLGDHGSHAEHGS
jgi:hypothetical protein